MIDLRLGDYREVMQDVEPDAVAYGHYCSFPVWSGMNTQTFKRRGRDVSINKNKEGSRFVAMDEKTRLLSKVVCDGDCWIWQDAKCKDGYGKFQPVKGTTERAHRASWRIHNGAVPSGMLCLHRCDVRACVNPAHLFLGTQKDNIADMIKKGRRGRPNAKINLAKATEIKQALASGVSGAVISRDLGITKAIVYSIKYGKTWRDA